MESSWTLQELIAEAGSAGDDHLAFARFVQQAEILCESFLSNEIGSQLSEHWFELEILNASALSDWEDEGRPDVWQAPWTGLYQADAVELLTEFVHLLRRAREEELGNSSCSRLQE